MRIRRLITVVALVITASATTTLSASAAPASPAVGVIVVQGVAKSRVGGVCHVRQRSAAGSHHFGTVHQHELVVLPRPQPISPVRCRRQTRIRRSEQDVRSRLQRRPLQLETPNDSSTYVVVAVGDSTTGLVLLSNQAGTGFMAPNGRGLDVKVLASAVLPDDGWATCFNATGICI